MSTEPSPDERDQLEDLTAAWQEYDRTFDVSVVADFLAEDMLILGPGQSPIEGKDAAIEYLDRSEDEATPEHEQWTEEIFVSGDLAVVRAAGGEVPEGADKPVDDGLKGLDVYRRTEDGEWEQIISVWNEHI